MNKAQLGISLIEIVVITHSRCPCVKVVTGGASKHVHVLPGSIFFYLLISKFKCGLGHV